MNTGNITVLGAGLACADIIKTDGLEAILPGGTAANVLSILAKLGFSSTLFCANYFDELGAWLKDSLACHGVNIVNFTDCHSPTPRVIEILDKEGNHSFQKTCPICGKNLLKVVLPNLTHLTPPILNVIERLNLFYYDRISEGIKRIAYLNKRGWNFYEPNSCRFYQTFLNSAKYANIIKFAEDRVPKMYVDLLIDDLQKSDVQLIIVSSGESGFRFSIRNESKMLSNWFFVDAAKASSVIDSSGAGDWMTAVFLDSFLRKYPFYVDQLDHEEICIMLDRAKQVAAYSCGFLGAQGIFKDQPAQRRMEEMFSLNLSITNSIPCAFNDGCQYCKI